MMRSFFFLLLAIVPQTKSVVVTELPIIKSTTKYVSTVLPPIVISIEGAIKSDNDKVSLSAEQTMAALNQPEARATIVAAEAVTLPKNFKSILPKAAGGIQEIDISSPIVSAVKNHYVESQIKVDATKNEKEPVTTANKSHVDVELQKSKLYHLTENIAGSPEEVPESSTIGFYVYFALSSAAILFIAYRVYRLRLSRAERKYGVHGDRSNQELTPLPLTIEDINSDDEDTTVFELNRQNIRIL